jgi:hypothetical protein
MSNLDDKMTEKYKNLNRNFLKDFKNNETNIK